MSLYLARCAEATDSWKEEGLVETVTVLAAVSLTFLLNPQALDDLEMVCDAFPFLCTWRLTGAVDNCNPHATVEHVEAVARIVKKLLIFPLCRYRNCSKKQNTTNKHH